MHEYAAAVDVFERLLEFQPDNLGHYTNLGRFYNHSLSFVDSIYSSAVLS